ncbi:MAG: hypothetical protein ACFFDP_11850, partial [Promethearchaeota archaeon]
AVLEKLMNNNSKILEHDDQALIVRFFNAVRDFDGALADTDIGVVDVYQPGLIPALVKMTGMDYDIHRYFSSKVAPKFNLDPVNLPPNLSHFLANYSGDFGYWSEAQISIMKSEILGGQSFEWHRHDLDDEEKLPEFAFHQNVAVSEEKLNQLSQLCNSLLDVQNLLANTIRQNWTLAELAKDKDLSVEVVMGDKFENIQNSTIINRSIVSDAVKAIEASQGTDVAEALETIAKAIETSRSVAAGALFESFSKELQKKEPDKSALREFWEGLTKIVPSIATMTGAVAKVASLFT